MTLMFETRNGYTSGILKITSFIRDADEHLTVTCTDNSKICFWNDTFVTGYEDDIQFYKHEEEFAQMCEDVYNDLINHGLAKIIVDNCSVPEVYGFDYAKEEDTEN